MKEAIRKFKEKLDIESSLLKRVRSHRYFGITVLVAALLLASCFHVWQRVIVLESVREVARLRADNVALLDNLRKVRAEIAHLSMAARIEKFAIDSLGMKLIPADRLFTLVPENTKVDPDQLAVMMSAIKRVVDYMPVISPNEARADELHIVDDGYQLPAGEKQ